MNGAGLSLSIRPWRHEWAAAVAVLIDAESDPFWVAQGHPMHGPDVSDAPRFRRTPVAFGGDRLVGAATVCSNRIHGGRLSCAVDVAARDRGRGVGRALLAAVRALAPATPVAAKVRPGTPAHHFTAAHGAVIYQRCPGIQLDPRHDAVQRWAAGCSAQNPVRTSSLAGMSRPQVAAAFMEQYQWVHEAWSPVTDVAALAEAAAFEAAGIDADLSSAAWLAKDLVATVFAFRDGRNQLDVVAETQQRHHSNARPALAAALARTLANAAKHEITQVTFDGHTSDPHLEPLLQQMPHNSQHPLLLMTLPPADRPALLATTKPSR